MNVPTPLGFDMDRFRQSESLVYSHFEKALDNGTVYVTAGESQQPLFYVEWAKYFLVFKFKPEEFVVKKKLFKKETTFNWKHLRKLGKETLKLDNEGIHKSDVEVTVISLYGIYGGWTELNFTKQLRLKFEEAKFEKVLKKKFEVDQFSRYLQLEQILWDANVDDPLYNEIKYETKRTKELYKKRNEEYKQELRAFHNRLRGNRQLEILSQSTAIA